MLSCSTCSNLNVSSPISASHVLLSKRLVPGAGKLHEQTCTTEQPEEGIGEIMLLWQGLLGFPSHSAAGVIRKSTNLSLVNARPVITAKPDVSQSIKCYYSMRVPCLF